MRVLDDGYSRKTSIIINNWFLYKVNNTVLSTHLSIAMNILTCLCCTVPDHIKTGIGYISLFAIMDAESDEPRAKRAKVQRQLYVFFNKPLVREIRYLLSIVTNISLYN
jgi:hypothetical protein